MPRIYFNWKLAIVLVLGFVVLGATAFGLRQWQRSRRAELGLDAGIKAYNEQRWEEAAKNLGRYIAVERDDVSSLLKYADAQLNIRPLKRNNVQQAVAAYRSVLRIEDSNSVAAIRLIKVYLQMGMPGEAELIAKRQSQTNQDPELRRMLALALAGQRKFNEAAAELKSIVAEYPEQILAYEALGQLTEQRPEDFSDPPEYWFNQAVENNPSSALAYIIRADFYLRSGDRSRALADLDQAEKQDLSDPAIRLHLAAQFINANALDKAETHLAAVQESEPASQALWQTWAQFARRTQSQEKMLKIAETGLKELSTQPWDFMPTAAELFIRCGQPDRATECISKLREKDIAPGVVTFLEGLVANQKGRPFEAVKCWYRAMQLGYESPRVRLALASTLSRLGDTQSALRQLRTLVSERPNLFDGRLALARLLAQTGDWAGTVEHARKAIELSPGSLGSALVYLQAQIQLAAARSAQENTQMWQNIDTQLASLDKATNGALEVKLLQFQLAVQRNNLAAGEALITELKKAHPSQIKVAMAEVDLLAAQEKEDEVILVLNKTIEEFPQDPEPVGYLAILLNRQDEREKCEGIIKDTLARIEEPGAQRELSLLLVGFYSRWGEEEKAYNLLTSLANKLPNDIPVKRRLLVHKQVSKNLEQAQQLVNDIKSLEGENGWQWRYEQARVWFSADDFENRYPQIISLLQENLLANPDDQSSRMLLAAAYERAEEQQLAISTYREALTRSPDDLRIIIPTVAALYKANEYGQAEEILNRASQQKLYHPELKRLELQSYLRRGQLDPASEILQDLFSSDPNNRAVCLSLALLKMRQDRFAEADQLLAKLKAQEPNALPVIVAQVQLNMRQDKPQEALKLCNDVVSDYNNSSAYLLRAGAYATLGQTDKAIEDFEHATILEPNNIEVLLTRSDFYRSIGELDRAIADIQQALSLSPNNAQIQRRSVLLFLTSSDRDKVRQGREILDKALESNPEDGELRLFKARVLLAEGTAPAIEEAAGILQKITEDQPKIPDAWMLLGQLLLGQGQPGKAIDIALRGLVHTPNDKSLLLLKARAEAVRSPALAIPTLRVLRELDPNDVDAAQLLASTYIAADEPDKAVSLLRKQVASCSSAADERRVNVALAVALHKNGNKVESQEIFDSLYQSAADDPALLLVQARLFKEDKLWSQLSRIVSHWCQNHTEDTHMPVAIAGELAVTEGDQAKKTAEDILRMVLQNNSDCSEAMSVLAMLLQTTGRSDESVKLYQRVLELKPDDVIAINNLAWIMCEEQGKHQQALELTQRGLKIAPNYVDLIDTNGMVHYRLREYDKAVRDFTRCIKLYPAATPSAVASYFHLGRALANLGQKERATENLKKALELNATTGGLTAKDRAEIQHLLEELSEGG